MRVLTKRLRSMAFIPAGMNFRNGTVYQVHALLYPLKHSLSLNAFREHGKRNWDDSVKLDTSL